MVNLIARQDADQEPRVGKGFLAAHWEQTGKRIAMN